MKKLLIIPISLIAIIAIAAGALQFGRYLGSTALPTPLSDGELPPTPHPAPVEIHQPEFTPVEQPVPEIAVAPHPQPAPSPFPQQASALTPRAPLPTPAIDAEPIPEPVARVALASVGRDPEAATVWLAAINDDRLPPNQRKDLIEDLNQDGFPDPKHLTADDLPLIENRLALIEQFANDPLDDTNAAAFDEAYKDLQNMHTKLTGQ